MEEFQVMFFSKKKKNTRDSLCIQQQQEKAVIKKRDFGTDLINYPFEGKKKRGLG